MILAPRAFLGVTGKVGAGDMVVMALLSTAHPGKEAFGVVRAGTVEAVGNLVVDPLDFVAGMQRISRPGIIGHYLGAVLHPVANEGQRVGL